MSCSKPKSYWVIQGEAQGTTYTLKYQGEQDITIAVDSIFRVIDLSMSTYLEHSILSRINRNDTTVTVDPHFEKVFTLAKDVFQKTNGAFDPSIGILVQAYGFGKQEHQPNLDSSTRDSILQFVGFDKITVENKILLKPYPQTQLDFNAIAQGYTVDVLADYLIHKNIQHFMIEVGGEVRAQGVNEKGKYWQIGIQNPMKNEVGAVETVIELQHQALATSGNYRKVKTDAAGKQYVHTINPKTGEATPSNLLSATVITNGNCALADAFATSFMVMGFKSSLRFINTHPEIKVFLVYDDNGTVKEYQNF